MGLFGTPKTRSGNLGGPESVVIRGEADSIVMTYRETDGMKMEIQVNKQLETLGNSTLDAAIALGQLKISTNSNDPQALQNAIAAIKAAALLSPTTSWFATGSMFSESAFDVVLDRAINTLANRGKQIDAIVDAAVNGPVISPIIGTTPDPLVKKIIYVDPLILDLDGDGIEITPLSAGVLFDADGDTIRTGTAWAAADDGMLVWDRNGNGQIDSGAELFGDETILANGQKARDGFAALAELDSNEDGIFDALDAQYANLRIWRDLNQDGVSQANELQDLNTSGIESINLTSTPSAQRYTDAILAQSGSFTRIDGSTGQAGSFVLAQNNFTRAFVPIAVSAEASTLPNLTGSGWVRDLQEAATQTPVLIDLLNQVKNASSRADYKTAVATLLKAWGNESGFNSASKQALAEGRSPPATSTSFP